MSQSKGLRTNRLLQYISMVFKGQALTSLAISPAGRPFNAFQGMLELLRAFCSATRTHSSCSEFARRSEEALLSGFSRDTQVRQGQQTTSHLYASKELPHPDCRE